MRKFASDFTRYHFLKVRRDMTMIDIDAVQFRQMEDGTERLRLIEYKHNNEQRGVMQMKLLEKFNTYMRALNNVAKKTKFELFLITGDFIEDQWKRYILAGNASIYNFESKKTKKINETDLLSFLNFKTEWEDLIG